MPTLTFTSDNYSSSIAVPKWFINELMPMAMGGYVKVYLYLLSAFYDNKSLSLEDTATSLSMLSSEVLSAIEYWEDKGLLKLVTLPDNNFELSFNFNNPNSKTTDKKVSTLKVEKPIKTISKPKTYIQQTRPNYSPSEISIYLKDPQVQHLYKIAEQSLGRLLSSSDQQVLFGLYDWLHMPIDLIEYLLNYCASRGHTNMRYIEKTAITWSNEGITTLELAKARAEHDKMYFKILSEVGLGTQNITQAQKETIDKWLNKYKFSMELILEGCKRTSLQAKNPSLNYLDSIFTSWHKNNVTSLEDVEKLDDAFMAKSQLQPNAKIRKKGPVKKTTFNNLQGRDWDFSELERLERDRMDRLLNEGS